jgi:hypothetical protein
MNKLMNSRYLQVSVVTGAVALMVAAGQLASFGAATPPKLSGERLASAKGTGGTSAKCKGASGSFTFKVSGHASGPYPGTFTASGKVVVKKNHPASYSAVIVISSPKGKVTITERLAKATGNNTFCLPGYGLAGIAASYQATVRSAGHSTRQRGTSTGAVSGGAAKTSALRQFLA